MTADEYVKGVREFADWVEQNADGLNAITLNNELGTLYLCTLEKETFAEYVRLMGKGEKVPDKTYFKVVREFGPIHVQAYVARDKVCREVTVMRPVKEWVCDEPILAAVDEQDKLTRGDALIAATVGMPEPVKKGGES